MEDDQHLVLDASIIIDICHGSILREALSLAASMISPDLVTGEVEDISTSKLEELGLQSRCLTSEEMAILREEAKAYKGLTHKDVASIQLADEVGAILLTGDDRLRQYAERRGIEVHGILWVLDRLVEASILNCEKAACSLRAIREAGSWLPEEECEERLALWEQGGDPR